MRFLTMSPFCKYPHLSLQNRNQIAPASRRMESEARAAIEDIEPGSMILIDESAGTWAVVTEEGLPDDTDDEAWALLCTTEDGQETAFIAGLGEIVTYRPS